MHGARPDLAQSSAVCGAKGEGMGLFQRKPKFEDEPVRCPVCTERLPDDADECAMCGADLKALRPWSKAGVGGPVER
jgi:hypothetical protein